MVPPCPVHVAKEMITFANSEICCDKNLILENGILDDARSSPVCIMTSMDLSTARLGMLAGATLYSEAFYDAYDESLAKGIHNEQVRSTLDGGVTGILVARVTGPGFVTRFVALSSQND